MEPVLIRSVEANACVGNGCANSIHTGLCCTVWIINNLY